MRNLYRYDKFLFKEYSDNTIRFNITNYQDTKFLGKTLGKIILQSFKNNNPLKGMYVYGRIGMGKTVLSTAVINAFENTENLLIDVKHKVQYRYYDTYPKCHHVDYYSINSRFFPCKQQIELKNDEFIIAEWCERLKMQNLQYFENDRLEIELYHCYDKHNICNEKYVDISNLEKLTGEGSMRFASMIGYGNGIAVIEALKQDQELSKIVVDPSELD